MKKLLLPFIIATSITFVYATTLLIDSAATTGYADTNCDASQLVGQAFQVQNTSTLDHATIRMKTNGTPTGNFHLLIYAMSGAYGSTAVPTGSILATSDNISAGSLTGTYATATVNFSGANRIAMTVGQNYVLTCDYANTSWPNAILFENKTPSFAGGNQSYFSGSWAYLSAYDMAFQLWGVSAAVSSPSTLGFFRYFNKRK